MDSFTVQVLPVARRDEWLELVVSAEQGERAEAQRVTLRRLGVMREHIYHQATPGDQLMVLVWKGTDQDKVGQAMGEMMQDPQSEHERYLATHMIPVIHGVDPTAAPRRR